MPPALNSFRLLDKFAYEIATDRYTLTKLFR